MDKKLVKKNKVKTSRKISTSNRAGLKLPVGRIHGQLKSGKYAKRVSKDASIFLTAVLEYLCTEILELSATAAEDNNRQRISPRHILLAVKNDDEINELFRGATIVQGGVLPNIHATLLSKNKKPMTDKDVDLKRELDTSSQEY